MRLKLPSDKEQWWIAAFMLGGIMVGLVPGAVYYAHIRSRIADKQECRAQYPYTSRSLNCDGYDESSSRIRSLDQKLDDAAALYVKDGKAKRVAVWVRDLETAQWASVGETETFAPASLMKVPLMVAYFKYSELDPGIFQSKLAYQPQSAISSSLQDFAVEHTPLVAGRSYTVEELIRDMIVYSDNDAAGLLLAHIDPALFSKVVIDLGLRIPQDSGDIDYVTPKSYATIFRMLYNASYLTRDLSEKALGLLSDKTALKFLAAPLPDGTVVASKFGEREVVSADKTVKTREFHDCGIVYKSPNPYSICIMTEGASFDDLRGIIESLSQLAYQEL